MKFNQTRFLLFTTLLLAVVFSAGCGILLQKFSASGTDVSSLGIKNPEVIKTFETAKANNKKVLIIFDAAWCGYCRKFNEITMKDAEVKKSLDGFEIVNVDVDKFPEVRAAFEKASGDKKITGVPTLMIFSSNGVHETRVTGYYKPPGFNKFLKKNL